jgi:mannosyl-3-phosphoglycerate phosphatase
MTTTPKIIVFTDLDGTLLDRETYSSEAAGPALQLIKQKDIPLIFSTSKTRAEIERHRKQMENDHPFISENGGAVFVPRGYFSFPFPYDRELEEYFVLELGTFYPRIIEVLNAIKEETGVPIKGFSDFTEEELVALCGLGTEEAHFAKEREYDEPFLVEAGEVEFEIIKEKILEKGMTCVTGGRFFHLMGENDKGKAVEILKQLYGFEFFSIATVGIGDSPNDYPMLRAVDYPILLNGGKAISPPIRNLICTEGSGPRAWNEAILGLIDDFSKG